MAQPLSGFVIGNVALRLVKRKTWPDLIGPRAISRAEKASRRRAAVSAFAIAAATGMRGTSPRVSIPTASGDSSGRPILFMK